MNRFQLFTDRYGRNIDYLRISVTDRCNLRCIYCMPPGGVIPRPKVEILTFEEIKRVVSVAVGLGITKVRVTGGEPLVRKGIVDFISALSSLSGIRDLSLTTNGVLLESYARHLVSAGLGRINISLDTLKAGRYRHITRLGEIKDVKAGIEKALEAGLNPVKINVVVMKGVNDDEIVDFVKLTRSPALWVRFIEFMPVNRSFSGYNERFIPATEIMNKIEKAGMVLSPAKPSLSNGPAEYYRLFGTGGLVGFISGVSRPFCSQCNRLRLTPAGLLKGCLFSTANVDLRPYLKNGRPDEKIEELFLSCLQLKPRNYREIISQSGCVLSMSEIGG